MAVSIVLSPLPFVEEKGTDEFSRRLGPSEKRDQKIPQPKVHRKSKEDTKVEL